LNISIAEESDYKYVVRFLCVHAAYRCSFADHAELCYPFLTLYIVLYVCRAVAGGGRSSARETIGRVAAAAIAHKLLHLYCGCEVCCNFN
jgi:chorismate synthase